MVDTHELAAIPLFASLTEPELANLARLFEARPASKGVELAGEGASGYSFYVLADGSASVTSGETTIAQLGPGDFFGEGAILGDGRRHATVTTTEPSRLLVMFGTEFRRMEQEHPRIAAAIRKVIEQRHAPTGA